MLIARRKDQAKYPQAWDELAASWYPGAGPSGTRLYDLSGRDNHGTLTNGPTWGVNRGQSVINLDGTNDHVNVPTSESLNFGLKPASISVWVAPTNISAYRIILVKRLSSAPFSQFSIATGFVNNAGGAVAGKQISIFWYNGGNLSISDTATQGYRTTADVVDGNLHSIIVVRGLSGPPKIYVDGVDMALTTIQPGITPVNADNDLPLLLGASTGGTIAMGGSLSQVSVYKRILHADDIKLLTQRPGIAHEPKPRVFYSIPASVKAWLFRRQSQIIGGGLG